MEFRRVLFRSKKAINRNKPKCMTAKRIGMITFWLLFSFMFFVVAINFVGGSSSGIENDRIESRNDLFTSEGVEFTKDFVKDYFTWSTDKHAKDIREYKLEPYFISSFDKLDELVFDRDWSSVAKKEDITLKEDRKSTRLNSSHVAISYAVFCLKQKN